MIEEFAMGYIIGSLVTSILIMFVLIIHIVEDYKKWINYKYHKN